MIFRIFIYCVISLQILIWIFNETTFSKTQIIECAFIFSFYFFFFYDFQILENNGNNQKKREDYNTSIIYYNHVKHGWFLNVWKAIFWQAWKLYERKKKNKNRGQSFWTSHVTSSNTIYLKTIFFITKSLKINFEIISLFLIYIYI